MRMRIQRGFSRKQEATERTSAFASRPFAPSVSRTAGPAVQRFTVIDPQDYQQAALHANRMFPSQKLDTSRTEQTVGPDRQITQKLSWVQQYTQNPPLKVSQNGRLAIESTVGQPKVFYGAADQIRTSRKRLIDVGSRITLKTNAPTLKVPRDPANIDGNTNTLVQVEPERSPKIDPRAQLMDANECDSVSQSIVNGKEAAIGNAVDGVELTASVSAQWGEINHIATALRRTRSTDQVSAFPGRYQQAEQSFPNVHNQQLPISREVQDYFAEGFWRRKHLVPVPQVLRALSLPDIPKDLMAQIYELHVGKTEQQRPDRIELLNHIEAFLKFQRVLEYEDVRHDNVRNAKLGVNEYAQPEVGESFSSLSQYSPKVFDEDGVLSHEADISNRGQDDALKVYSEMLALRKSASLLGMVAASEHQKAQGVVPFREHHAAVVAKDGTDSVTFENYNRSAEEDTLKEDLWNQLFQEFDQFDDNADLELQNIKAEVRRIKESDRGPIQKMMGILDQRKRHLDKLRAGFVTVQANVSLKLETNLGEDSNDLWHFNMYGPAHATYVDAEGSQKPQSFHEVWSPSIPNALTVRTTARADQYFLRDKKVELGPRIAQVAYRDLKQSSFADSKEQYQGRLASLKSTLLGPLEAARTRVEASIAYRNALELLEVHEEVGDPLTGSEIREAEALAAGDVQKARGIAMQIAHEKNMESDRLQFNRNTALSLLPSNYQLGLKYALWSTENRKRIGVLEAKRRFFLAFAS